VEKNIKNEEPRITDEGYGRLTKTEMEIIKQAFGSNEPLLKLLRKLLLPQIDYDAPIGQLVDTYMGIPIDGKTDQEIARATKSRNDVVMHVESQMLQLHSLANIPYETPEERRIRLLKDSTK